MQGQRKYSLHTIIFGIALILFCLVIISTYMMSGLYARYRSAGLSGDDARVAAFSVEAAWGTDVNIDWTETADGAYQVILTNNSEVAVRCDMVLTLNADVMDAVEITLGDSAGTVSGNTITFGNICELAPNGTNSAHQLKFSVEDVDFFTKNATGEAHSEPVSFKAIITCTQID